MVVVKVLQWTICTGKTIFSLSGLIWAVLKFACFAFVKTIILSLSWNRTHGYLIHIRT